MSDTNERSVASAGSVAGEPAAWVVFTPDEDFLTRSRRDAESWMEDGLDVISLYLSPTLTDAEREAIERVARWLLCELWADTNEAAEDSQTLQALLNRTK